MTEQELKDKMKLFISLRKENEALAKAREDKLIPSASREAFRDEKRSFAGNNELESQAMPTPGVSVAGIESRRANPADQSYMKVGTPNQHKARAKTQHARIIEHIKSTSPNLPKSEDLDKAKLSIPLGPGMGTISGIDIGGDPEKKKKKKITTGSSYTAISSVPPVAGAAAPLAASELKPIPAAVSDPMIRNRVDSQHPKQINGPNIINSYKSESPDNRNRATDVIRQYKQKRQG